VIYLTFLILKGTRLLASSCLCVCPP